MRYSLSFVLSLVGLSHGAHASKGTLFLPIDMPLSCFLSPASSFDEVIESSVASPVLSSSDSDDLSSTSEEERHFMDPWAISSHTTPVPTWTPEMFFESEDKSLFGDSSMPVQNVLVENAVLRDADNFPPLLRDDVPSLPGVQEEGSRIHHSSNAKFPKITHKRLVHQATLRQAKALVQDLDAKESTALKGKAAAYLIAKTIEVSGQLNVSDPEKYALLSHAAELYLNTQNYVRARWCVDQVLRAKRTYVRLAVSERIQTVDAILLVQEQSKK